MRYLLAVLAALVLSPALADSEARIGADFIRVTALPCSDAAVVALIQQAGGDPVDWRAARAEFAGIAFEACWRPDFQQRVAYLIYSDGDSGQVPFGALKPLREA